MEMTFLESQACWVHLQRGLLREACFAAISNLRQCPSLAWWEGSVMAGAAGALVVMSVAGLRDSWLSSCCRRRGQQRLLQQRLARR